MPFKTDLSFRISIKISLCQYICTESSNLMSYNIKTVNISLKGTKKREHWLIH